MFFDRCNHLEDIHGRASLGRPTTPLPNPGSKRCKRSKTFAKKRPIKPGCAPEA